MPGIVTSADFVGRMQAVSRDEADSMRDSQSAWTVATPQQISSLGVSPAVEGQIASAQATTLEVDAIAALIASNPGQPVLSVARGVGVVLTVTFANAVEAVNVMLGFAQLVASLVARIEALEAL